MAEQLKFCEVEIEVDIKKSDEFDKGKNKEIDAKHFIGYKNDKKLGHYSSSFHK